MVVMATEVLIILAHTMVMDMDIQDQEFTQLHLDIILIIIIIVEVVGIMEVITVVIVGEEVVETVVDNKINITKMSFNVFWEAFLLLISTQFISSQNHIEYYDILLIPLKHFQPKNQFRF